MKYFAYRHTNGTAHLKRWSKIAYEEAQKSPFVAILSQPFKTASRKVALSHSKVILRALEGRKGGSML